MDYLEWLNRGLKKPGKTQRGLGRALNIDPAGIWRMTKGLRQIKADEVPVIARYLEEPPPGQELQTEFGSARAGERIRRRMAQLGLTDRALAKHAQIELAELRAMIAGEVAWTPEAVEKLAAMLQISIYEMARLCGVPSPHGPQDSEAISREFAHRAAAVLIETVRAFDLDPGPGQFADAMLRLTDLQEAYLRENGEPIDTVSLRFFADHLVGQSHRPVA